MTRTEFGQYRLISSLIATSFWWSLGPVWYQPTIFSLARNRIYTQVALQNYWQTQVGKCDNFYVFIYGNLLIVCAHTQHITCKLCTKCSNKGTLWSQIHSPTYWPTQNVTNGSVLIVLNVCNNMSYVLTIHFLKHAIHIFKVVMIKKPYWLILIIFIKWNLK